MSVTINNMDMPNSCGECHFCHSENLRSWCCPVGREDVYFDAIPDWCPLKGGAMSEEKNLVEEITELRKTMKVFVLTNIFLIGFVIGAVVVCIVR